LEFSGYRRELRHAKVTASPAKLRAENNDACTQVYSSSRDRYFRLCAHGHYQEAAENRCPFPHNSTDSESHHLRWKFN